MLREDRQIPLEFEALPIAVRTAAMPAISADVSGSARSRATGLFLLLRKKRCRALQFRAITTRYARPSRVPDRASAWERLARSG